MQMPIEWLTSAMLIRSIKARPVVTDTGFFGHRDCHDYFDPQGTPVGIRHPLHKGQGFCLTTPSNENTGGN